MSFKVIGDFESHYMVKHPDGSSFPIAKKGISKEMHERIKGMSQSGSTSNPVKLYGGGQVSDPVDTGGVSATPSPGSADYFQSPHPELEQQAQNIPTSNEQTVGQKLTDIFIPQGIQKMGSAISNKISDLQAIGDQKPSSNVTAQPMQDLFKNPSVKNASYESGTPDNQTPPDDGMTGAYGQQYKALAGQQGDVSQFSKQMADSNKALESAKQSVVDGQAKIDAEHAPIIDKYRQQQASLSDQLMTGKADPNRVYNNMSTGNKVLSAISLVLGGIGSGLTGKPNAALEVINNAIDKDMQAQRMDQDNLKERVNLNHQAMSDENQDYSLKKASMLTAAQAQIGIAAAKSQNAATTMQAHTMMAGIENQKQALMQDYAQKKAVFTAVQKNPGDVGVLGHAVTMIIPKEQQGEAFKELNRVSAANKARDSINTYFGGANDKNTIMGRIMHGGAEPADMTALQANIMPVIKDLEGRVNEQEIEILHKLSPGPGDSQEKVKTKLLGLNDFINAKSQSAMLSAYGLMPKSNGVYNEKGQKNFNEGKAK